MSSTVCRWFFGVTAVIGTVGCGGEERSRGREATDASPAGIWSNCDFEQGAGASYLEPAFVPQSAELRIFAIYEASSTLGDAAGRAPSEATVHVDRAARTVLVLSAREATHWTVTAENGLEKVILDGHDVQSATVPAGVTVESSSGKNAFAPCGYADEGDCRTADLVGGAERLTGLSMTGFVGCRYGNEFGLYDGE